MAKAETAIGFATGLKTFFRGLSFVVTTPSVWPLAMVPVVVATTLAGITGYTLIGWLPQRVALWVAGDDWALSTLGGFGVAAIEVLAAVLSLVVALGVGIALAQPLSGPALEQIVRKREAALGAPERPKTSFFEDVWRSLQSVVLAHCLGLPVLALLFLLSFAVPPLQVITWPLKMVVMSFMVAWDVCDYPLSVRGYSVGERFRLFRAHQGAIVGFGLGLALCALIPCLLLLLLPAGVAGATELVWKLDSEPNSG